MSTLAQSETRRQLRYNYSEAERLDLGKALAESLNKHASTEADLDRIKSDFKARLSSIDTEINKLKESVFSGYELREYVCFRKYDFPLPGRKSLFRKEPPHDFVCDEEMTEADRQTVMTEIQQQASGDAPDPDFPPAPAPAPAPVTESKPVKTGKRNRYANAGTVSIPADEGSRDDAGEDSKNNL